MADDLTPLDLDLPDDSEVMAAMRRVCPTGTDRVSLTLYRYREGKQPAWVANLSPKGWNEAELARKFGAGDYKVVFFQNKEKVGEHDWSVDDSAGGLMTPVDAGAANPFGRQAQAMLSAMQAGGGGGASSDLFRVMQLMMTMQMHSSTQMTQVLCAAIGAKGGGGMSIEQLAAWESVQSKNRPDPTLMLNLGKEIGEAKGSGASEWAQVIEAAGPQLQGITQAFMGGIAGMRRNVPPQAQAQQAQQRPALPAAQTKAAQPAQLAGTPAAAQGATPPPEPADEQAQSLQLLTLALLKSADNPNRDPATYANLALDWLGDDAIDQMLAAVPDGGLADMLIAQVPQLTPSHAFLCEVEKELRAAPDGAPAANIPAPALVNGAKAPKGGKGKAA